MDDDLNEMGNDAAAPAAASGRVAGAAAADEDARGWAVARASWLVVLTPLIAGVLVIGLGYGLA